MQETILYKLGGARIPFLRHTLSQRSAAPQRTQRHPSQARDAEVSPAIFLLPAAPGNLTRDERRWETTKEKHIIHTKRLLVRCCVLLLLPCAAYSDFLVVSKSRSSSQAKVVSPSHKKPFPFPRKSCLSSPVNVLPPAAGKPHRPAPPRLATCACRVSP